MFCTTKNVTLQSSFFHLLFALCQGAVQKSKMRWIDESINVVCKHGDIGLYQSCIHKTIGDFLIELHHFFLCIEAIERELVASKNFIKTIKDRLKKSDVMAPNLIAYCRVCSRVHQVFLYDTWFIRYFQVHIEIQFLTAWLVKDLYNQPTLPAPNIRCVHKGIHSCIVKTYLRQKLN